MPVARLRWSAKTKPRHNKGGDDRDCRDRVVVQTTWKAPATPEASRSTEHARPSSVSSAMHKTLEPTLTQSDALTEAISTVEQAGPSRQSSEYLSQAMMETLEEAARKASKRLSRPDRERVDKYLQRLRLLQELSRDFARYDIQCRVPLRRALNELTAIAFCGGGVLGTAYVGALSVLEQHGLDYARIKRFAGTSAGAIMASTLAVGYHAAGCMKQLQKLNFEDLMTPDLSALTRGRGLSSGKYLEQWMGQVLAERTGDSNITMAQVLERYGKELVIVTTELDTGRERKLTPYADPDLPVKSAVRMSAGIPVVFDVYHYQGHQYCDGGLVNNWPVDALPQDGTGLGMVTFSFNDFIHYELYHLLWGPIPPETRGFDYERMGHAFAQALYSHSEKATTIFGVATRSMRIIYDRLTREQIYRYAERWPGGLSMPRAVFLCVGEYGALDTDISTTGQLELFEMGRLSMYVEVQRFMHELEYASTHSGSSIRDTLPISGGLYRQRLREASALNEVSPPGPETHERASITVPVTDSVTANARPMHQPTDQHTDRHPVSDDANADVASAASENERMGSVHSNSSASLSAELSAPSHTHVHFTEPANQESGLSPERQTSLSGQDAIDGPRRLWQAPEELFWRHIFLLSLREGRKLGPQVHARLFPSRLRRSARMGGLRAEAVLIQQDITRQVRSIWQNLRLCGIGCFALTIQCATCCQVARCVKDDTGIDDATLNPSPSDRVASETAPEPRE